ncbi:MAG: glycosyltransferase family 2 protein [Rhodopirellula sp.]|nr:glycosyltransferase family 2 protein [Rhodopirellula sp.]
MPAYNEAGQIEAALEAIPSYVRTILVVDDASSDDTPRVVRRMAERDPRIVLVRHPENRGVGGAMVTGYRKAVELGADIVVKIDADGQMSPDDLPALLRPLIRGEADYAKGNRFRDFRTLAHMPPLRRAGNMVLSFLTKAAVGYWQCFDPCNGYVAIRGDVLRELPLESIPHSFFFETSMLAELYLLRAVVRDVPMPARYGNERSHLSIRRVLVEFPCRLARCFARRILLAKFIYDFSIGSVYLLTGLPMLLAGLVYGLNNWVRYAQAGEGAPTGTVVIPTMLIILGFQLLLSAIHEDLQSAPHEPICGGVPLAYQESSP